MKRVPKKLEQKVQYEVIRNWSISFAETNISTKEVQIFSAKELLKSPENKSNESNIVGIVISETPCKSKLKKRR